VQNERDQRRVFHIAQEDVRAASDVVAGMLQMNDYQMHVLFDSGATHSFITNKNVTKLSKETKRVEKDLLLGHLWVKLWKQMLYLKGWELTLMGVN
jgi:phosphoribosyl-dephospho-CoA transferase